MKKQKVDCPATGRYCRARKASPKKFAKGSFRTITRGKVKIVIGCPKRKWNKKTGRCKVGTRAQTVLYPRSHPKCAPCR